MIPSLIFSDRNSSIEIHLRTFEWRGIKNSAVGVATGYVLDSRGFDFEFW
jgi:hypothetical protein